MPVKLEKIGAGDLNIQITLKKRTRTQNNFNEEISTYTTLGTVWAKLEKESITEEKAKDYIKQVSKRYNFYIRSASIANEEDLYIVYKRKYFEVLENDNMDERNIITKLITKRFNTDNSHRSG